MRRPPPSPPRWTATEPPHYQLAPGRSSPRSGIQPCSFPTLTKNHRPKRLRKSDSTTTRKPFGNWRITSLLLVPAASWIYAAAAVASGLWFIIMATRLHSGVTKGTPVKPMQLFFLSNNYLSVLFVALSVDAVLGWDNFFTIVSGS